LLGKQFLHFIYTNWYLQIASNLPPGDGPVLELGSGPGFIQTILPGVITTEILKIPWVDAYLDAMHLPFPNHSLRAIVMIDVFHHIPRPRLFLGEAQRCLQDGGIVFMIEPWNTVWSRLIYCHFHPENFDVNTKYWEFESQEPLYQSNQALPWIIFQRDRQQFKNEFPYLKITRIEPQNMFTYIASGGFSTSLQTLPILYPVFSKIESLLRSITLKNAMFAAITLYKTEETLPE
jgi:SAM-dependent methyltransferase